MQNLRILRKVRKEFDYRGYLDEHVAVRSTGGPEIRICCPNCHEQKFKCYINTEKNVFNCFKCDFRTGSYDVFDLVALVEGITRAQAMIRVSREYAEVAPSWEELIETASNTVLEVEEFEPTPTSAIETLSNMPHGSYLLNDSSSEQQKPYWNYLLDNRGFTEDEVRAVGAYFVPAESLRIFDKEGKYKGDIGHRILFPVYGGNHSLVSWLARSTDGSEPKYFNAPDSESHRTLWPFVPSKNNRAIIVEGLIDALAVRRFGLDSYATLGKSISYDQIELLKKWNITSVVLFWDKKDAKREMRKAIEELKLHFDEVLVPDLSDWPSTKDSGDTLKWNEGSELLKELLTTKLIDVNSLEFATWYLQ